MTRSAADEAFRPDINALRALAVAAVIAFHFGVPGASSGFIGVDVFFVISGYLIGGQIQSRIERRQFSLVWFFANRIRRIVPALFVVCLAASVWGWFFLLPADYIALVRSVRGSMSFKSNVEFASQLNYFDLGAAYKPLLHTWSLSVEAQFYLVLPLLLLALSRLPRLVRPLVVLAVTLASLAAAVFLSEREGGAHFFSFAARAWEFIPGAAVAWYSGGRPALSTRTRLSNTLAVVAWLALAASCVWLPAGAAWPNEHTLVPVLLTAFIIALGEGRPVGRIASVPPVQHVGRISYSLYLWHWPLLVCWRLTFVTDAPTPGDAAFLCVVTWALAWLSWRFVEEPVRRSSIWGAPMRLFPAYTAALATAAFVAFAVKADEGAAWRLPAYVAGARAAAVSNVDLHEGNCWNLAGGGKGALEDACRFGPAATAPEYAFWGDSHALQYQQVLAKQSDSSGMAGMLFHWPGCEPYLSGGTDPQCTAHNLKVLQYLERTPSIRTVVISIRQNTAERTANAWSAAAALLDRGLHVVFIGPLPEALKPVAQEWFAHELLQRRTIPDVTVPVDAPTRVASYSQRLTLWRKDADIVRTRYPDRFTAIDVSSLFCDERQCWVVRGGVGLFRDADHLTNAGTSLVMTRLMPALRGAPDKVAGSVDKGPSRLATSQNVTRP